MEIFKVTIVGGEIFRFVEETFELVGLNQANRINTGMLGNLKTLTYIFEIPEEKVIKLRRLLMEKLYENNTRVTPMYVHGNWMHVFVFKAARL